MSATLEGDRLTQVAQRCRPRAELGHPGLPIILQYSHEVGRRHTGKSVVPATGAADMLRFVEVLFDDMCKFVAEAGTIEFFMVRGIVRGSWKSAPAHFFTRTFWKRCHPKSSGVHALLN